MRPLQVLGINPRHLCTSFLKRGYLRFLDKREEFASLIFRAWVIVQVLILPLFGLCLETGGGAHCSLTQSGNQFILPWDSCYAAPTLVAFKWLTHARLLNGPETVSRKWKVKCPLETAAKLSGWWAPGNVSRTIKGIVRRRQSPLTSHTVWKDDIAQAPRWVPILILQMASSDSYHHRFLSYEV